MNRHKKPPARKTPEKVGAKRKRLSWAVGLGLAGMALWTISSNLARNRALERSQVSLDPGRSLGPGGKGAIANARSARFATNNLMVTDLDAHYNLALALAKLGNREAAEREYLEALRIYPDYAEARNNLGNLLVAEAKYGEAITQFQAALKISSEDASAHNNLGTALARQGKVSDAIPCFQDAIRLKPDYVDARYNLGIAFLAQRMTNEAISQFADILQRRPDFVPAQRGLAKARQLQGK